MANKKTIPLPGAGSQPRRIAEIKREERRLKATGSIAPTRHPNSMNLSDSIRNRQPPPAAAGSAAKKGGSANKGSAAKKASK